MAYTKKQVKDEVKKRQYDKTGPTRVDIVLEEYKGAGPIKSSAIHTRNKKYQSTKSSFYNPFSSGGGRITSPFQPVNKPSKTHREHQKRQRKLHRQGKRDNIV